MEYFKTYLAGGKVSDGFKKTIIYETNSTPPINYIWAKPDGLLYEHINNTWETLGDWSADLFDMPLQDCKKCFFGVNANTPLPKMWIIGTAEGKTYKWINNVLTEITILKDPAAGHDYVDLGLRKTINGVVYKVCFATCNIGADEPEAPGDFFQWGESNTEDGNYSWENYKFSPSLDGPFSKYNTLEHYGPIDNKTTLDLEDDAARNCFKGSWRMPTKDEMHWLLYNCNWSVDYSSVYDIRENTVTGPNNKSIILPSAGLWRLDEYMNPGRAAYWTSDLRQNLPYAAYYLSYYGGDVCSISDSARYYGMSIRPVIDIKA